MWQNTVLQVTSADLGQQILHSFLRPTQAKNIKYIYFESHIITSADCSWSTQHLHMQFTLYLYKHRHTHIFCTFSHILPLTLPLITPIRHRKETENIFLLPLTPPASPFFMLVRAGTPSGSTLGFKEQLMCHMAPLSFSSLQYHTDLQPSLASGPFLFYLPPLPSLFILCSFSVGNPAT